MKIVLIIILSMKTMGFIKQNLQNNENLKFRIQSENG